MLHSTDTERLYNKEFPRADVWISLRIRNRRDLADIQGVVGDETMRDQVGVVWGGS